MTSALRKIVVGLYAIRRRLLSHPIFTSTILPAIPRPLRWTLRKVYLLPADLIDRLLRQRGEMVPPKSQMFVGSVDDFESSGERLLSRLVGLECLTPSSHVLDIGCGIGRLAVPLTSYLSRDGSYKGLDIVPSGIKWCDERIASKYSNFEFTLADVFNKEYHPNGRLKACEYQFPYANETFDVAVLASVFTHMLPVDMEHYIAEIARVLRKRGRCFATYSLINPESRLMMESGQSDMRFKHNSGPYWTVSAKVPELAVAYDEEYVQGLFEKYGLSVGDRIYYGSWCVGPPFRGPESGLSQDVVVTIKG
jgi:ubiquinone/menaquinone biosynthesis C-methylase UbiE